MDRRRGESSAAHRMCHQCGWLVACVVCLWRYGMVWYGIATGTVRLQIEKAHKTTELTTTTTTTIRIDGHASSL